MNPILNELKLRGLMSDSFGPVEENFKPGEFVYCGTDPSADSLGVHHLLAFITLKHLQQNGMRPIVLLGTATASLGDPSFKEKERETLSMETIMHNTECIKKQLEKILDFDEAHENHAIFVNNYEWMSKFNYLDFMRDIGKKMTVNYMMAKDSVKTRLARDGQGLSFCEFSYSCIQAYDFIHLYEKYGCKNQIGGKDQTGNIDSAFVLGHKRNKVDNLSAIVWDLLLCADGRKFGKSEGNAIWLDPEKTSPYQFMQFWLNQSDIDSESFIKKFTLIPLNEINDLIEEHRKAPEKRLLQRTLAKYMTCMVHSEEAYNNAVAASEILFGKGTKDTLQTMSESTLLAVFKDVKKVEVDKSELVGISIVDIASEKAQIASKTELRKLIKGNGFSVNKEKVTDIASVISEDSLLNGKYVLMQKGKKDYCLIIAH